MFYFFGGALGHGLCVHPLPSIRPGDICSLQCVVGSTHALGTHSLLHAGVLVCFAR